MKKMNYYWLSKFVEDKGPIVIFEPDENEPRKYIICAVSDWPEYMDKRILASHISTEEEAFEAMEESADSFQMTWTLNGDGDLEGNNYVRLTPKTAFGYPTNSIDDIPSLYAAMDKVKNPKTDGVYFNVWELSRSELQEAGFVNVPYRESPEYFTKYPSRKFDWYHPNGIGIHNSVAIKITERQIKNLLKPKDAKTNFTISEYRIFIHDMWLASMQILTGERVNNEELFSKQYAPNFRHVVTLFGSAIKFYQQVYNKRGSETFVLAVNRINRGIIRLKTIDIPKSSTLFLKKTEINELFFSYKVTNL